MKRAHCDKEIADGADVSIYDCGKRAVSYCSAYCLALNFRDPLAKNATMKKLESKKK